MSLPADGQTPLERFVSEALRVGYLDLDAKSLLYGYLLGRAGFPIPDERIRWIAETLLSDRRGPHLPRSGDVDSGGAGRSEPGSDISGESDAAPGNTMPAPSDPLDYDRSVS